MTGLKTLGDLQNVSTHQMNMNCDSYIIRHEAIKLCDRWGFAKKISDDTKVIRLSDVLNFFNITEKDLK